MRVIASKHYKPGSESTMPWNDCIRWEWLANHPSSAKRQTWIDRMRELSEIPENHTGLRLEFDEYGSSTLVDVYP